jgi:hypothetical protein
MPAAVGLGDPLLVGDRVSERCRRHVGGVGEDDVALDARQLVGELFQQRHEREVGHDHAVLGVIDDPGDLVGKQPRVDGVVDGADAGDAVPGFQVAPGIPGEGRHPVARLDAIAHQALRHLLGPGADIRIGRGVDRPLDRARDDAAPAVIGRRMIDHAMNQQRPVLHQPEHVLPLRRPIRRISLGRTSS